MSASAIGDYQNSIISPSPQALRRVTFFYFLLVRFLFERTAPASLFVFLLVRPSRSAFEATFAIFFDVRTEFFFVMVQNG